MRRTVATVLMTVTLFLSGALIAFLQGSEVHAAGDVDDIAVTDQKDRAVKAFARDVAEENGVAFSEATESEILPVFSGTNGSQGNALVLTNTVGNTVTKDVFMFMDDEGAMALDPTNAYREENLRSGTTVNFPSNEKYVVHGTAVYNVQIDPSSFFSYYQPVGAYYVYYKNSPCNVGRIRLEYITDGFAYSYPGFTLLDMNEVTYVIAVDKYNPLNSTSYSKTQPYPSNWVISVAAGSPFVGKFLTFYCVVDGAVRTATIPF